MSTRAPPTFFRLAASYQRGAQGLETPMHLTFDPVSAAWDTFKFWDKHETSTDNLTSHHPGPGERTGQKSNALAFPDLGHPAGRMQQAEKTLGEPGLTSFPISAIIETCPSPTRCWLPAPPTASPPWVRSLVSGFFVSSSLPTRPAWWSAKSKRNSASPLPPFPTISKN